MRNMKKIAAVVLAATMVLGSSLTAFADDPAGGNSGSISGTGTSEGHVEKQVLNVVLPTVEAGTSPFAYTMDPERLIQGTDAAKYADGTTFPAEETDTGVYFLTGTNTYANTSNVLQAINKSSCAVTLTVKVKATAGANDITLATSATPATDAAELYLGLSVGDTVTVVSASEQTVTKTIAGSPANFEVAVVSDAYTYQEKADATTWKAVNISMTGAVSNHDIAANTTAPTIDITWSWAKAADGATADTDVVDYSTTPPDAAPSIATTTGTYSKANGITISGVSLGAGASGATAIDKVQVSTASGSYVDLDTANWSYSNGTLTVSGTWGGCAAGDARSLKVIFNDSAPTSVVLNMTIAE